MTAAMAAAGAAGGATRRFETRRASSHAIDAAALLVLFGAGLLGYTWIYGTPFALISGLIAIVVGLGTAYVCAWRQWGTLAVLLMTLGAYFVLGTPFVSPAHARWGLVPTGASLKELVTAPALSWQSLFTVMPPVGTSQGLLAVLFISGVLLSVIAGTLAARTRAWGAALLGPAVYLALAIVYGTTQETFPLVQSLVVGIVGLGWAAWRYETARLDRGASTVVADEGRRDRMTDPVVRRRLVLGTAVLLVAALVTGASSPALRVPDGQTRTALRDTIVPPLNPQSYVNPLAGFRAYANTSRETTMFTVEGAHAGDRVRIATMDHHDGLVYDVAGGQDPAADEGAFQKTSPDVDLVDPESVDTHDVRITVGAYRSVFVPVVDHTRRISFTGESAAGHSDGLYYNRSTGDFIDTGGIGEGDAYDLSVYDDEEPSEAEQRRATFAPVDMPSQAAFSPQIRAQALTFTEGATTDFERAQKLADGLKNSGYFSHGLTEEGEAKSLPGHGGARLTTMLAGVDGNNIDEALYRASMIGDDEQYAALAGVMGRSLDMPVRVVMGFEIEDTEGGKTEVEGGDVRAWIEVKFNDLGWVAFDPVPDEDEAPTVPKPRQSEQDQPQVPQPPPPPVEPPDEPPGFGADAPKPKDENDPGLLSTWYGIVLVAASPFALVGLVIGAIVGAKAWRRRRRRHHGPELDRVLGGWNELMDVARDAGASIPRHLTREEMGHHLDRSFPRADVSMIARGTDALVFGPGMPDDATVQRHWDGVVSASAAVHAGMGRWAAFRARTSVRSLIRARSERGRGPVMRAVRAGGGYAARAVRAVRGTLGRRTPRRKGEDG